MREILPLPKRTIERHISAPRSRSVETREIVLLEEPWNANWEVGETCEADCQGEKIRALNSFFPTQ